MPFKYPSLIDRILANSVRSTENFYNGTPCWEWTGSVKINRSGMKYAVMTRRIVKGPRKGKVQKVLAHREVIKGIKGRRLSRRSVGRHLCDNTICVNPEHLAGGQQRTNIRECVRRGRHKNAYGPTMTRERTAA